MHGTWGIILMCRSDGLLSERRFRNEDISRVPVIRRFRYSRYSRSLDLWKTCCTDDESGKRIKTKRTIALIWQSIFRNERKYMSETMYIFYIKFTRVGWISIGFEHTLLLRYENITILCFLHLDIVRHL